MKRIPWFEIESDRIRFNAASTRNGVQTVPVHVQRIAKLAAQLCFVRIGAAQSNGTHLWFPFNESVGIDVRNDAKMYILAQLKKD